MTQVGAGGGRVASVDLVRGGVMVLMVLDHVREYLASNLVDPTDLATTTPALFLTRWATHFCAPAFFLLAGVSASLSGERRSRAELARGLLARGAWLIVLEQTWGNVFMFFAWPRVVLGLVLWGLGWSMIVLAGLIYLPRAAIGGGAVALIALHNLLDGIPPAAFGPFAPAWNFLHAPGLPRLPGGVPYLAGYPLIPWVGVMALGYALGPVFREPAPRRRRTLLALGLGSAAAFVGLRWLNAYGDPRPWTPQASPTFTALSFVNCAKYPPSLLFLLMTLGPTFLALAAADGGGGRLGGPVRTLGQVPLCFYLLQWPVAHGLAVLIAVAGGQPTAWMFRPPPSLSPPGYDHGLPTIYLAWAVVVALLAGPSAAYAAWWRRRARPPAAARPPAP